MSEALVLAAGKGTRMRSSLPKVLHPLAGKPMLVRVLNTLRDAGFPHPLVLVGYQAERIEQAIGDRCRYIRQEEQLGTGHAVRVALEALPPDCTRLVVIHGDEPLIGAEVLRQMLDLQAASNAAIVLLTTHVADTRGFGRVIRQNGVPVALPQEGDLSSEEQKIDEVNLGAYVFDVAFLRQALPGLQPHPPKGEYYLTDLVAVAARDGREVRALTISGGAEVMGVNDLVHLEEASRVIYRQTNRRLMLEGVTIVDSASTFIDDEAQIAPETVIHPFTIITGPTRIGRSCEIGPGSTVHASRIGDRCRITSSVLEDSEVGDDVQVGPYAHLRQGARVERGAEIGNYAEIKNSTLGPGTKMHHFSYVGDARVGAEVNISAGVITCNYDGRRKHATVIEDGAFIGSDTMLRAPIHIGVRAVTGAGSVVTKDVPAETTVAGVPARILGTKRDEVQESAPKGERDGRS